MYTYVFVVCACLYVCAITCMYTCILYVCVCMYVYMGIYIHVHVCVYAYVFVVCVCVCVCMCSLYHMLITGVKINVYDIIDMMVLYLHLLAPKVDDKETQKAIITPLLNQPLQKGDTW